MATIGERLSEARKNFGIDIRSAAEATKIRSDFLAALEENKPEKIRLADVYKVGFLRVYAKYLKLDADKIVAEFRQQIGFHTSPAQRSVHHGNDSAGGNDEEGEASVSAANIPALLRSGKGIAALVIVVCVILAIALLAMKGTGTDAAGTADGSAATAEGPIPVTPETQLYEFQVISKITQNVTIIDCYGQGEGTRAKLFDQTISANRPTTLRGRGVLEIRDGGKSNLEIRFPTREALTASADARTAVPFTEADAAGRPFTNEGNWWTADPYLESR